MMDNIFKQQKGISGLETAIILISFVVLAGVFAYTVLSAGLFSTEKSQEAVYSGLQKAQGALGLKGSVKGVRDTLNPGGNGSLGKVNFTAALFSDGDPVDLTSAYAVDPVTGALVCSNPGSNRLQISFIDQNLTIRDCAWTAAWIGNNNGDAMLDPGEKVVISVWLHAFDGATWGPPASESPVFVGTNYLDTDHTFCLEIKPTSGSTLNIQRTTPAFLFNVVDMH
jgi:flagellin FlaB